MTRLRIVKYNTYPLSNRGLDVQVSFDIGTWETSCAAASPQYFLMRLLFHEQGPFSSEANNYGMLRIEHVQK